MGKFPALYKILISENLLSAEDVVAPREADWNDLKTVHLSDYLSHLSAGSLDRRAERRMGLPWSDRLVYRSRLAVQGTVNAAFMALQQGIAANLAGGTHHAMPTHGEGFCVLNDVAVAAQVLKRSQWIRRALVVDLDVHQGNGTAYIFADDPDIYTFSIHGEKNYPFKKPPSDCDVALPDSTTDEVYLSRLADHLPQVIAKAQPDLIFYLAGIDPMAGDRYGRLHLSREGLHQRDRFVLETAYQEGIPLTLLMSGGYAETPEATADLHAIAHREASAVYG